MILLCRNVPKRAVPWESLAQSAEGLIRLLGLEAALHKAKRGRSFGVRIAGPNPTRFSYPAWQIDRSVFDRLMLAEAHRHGAMLVEEEVAAFAASKDGVFVSLRSGDGVAARWAIDASGRGRTLVRKVYWPTLLLSEPLIVRSAMIRSTDAEFDLDNHLQFSPTGWLWRTRPWRKRQSWTALQRAADSLADDMSALLAASHLDSHRTTSATWTLVQPRGTLPLLSVGDAMGTTDPASGTGLLNAFSSALSAARTIASIMSGGAAPAESRRAYAEWSSARIEAQAHVLAGHYRQQGLSVTTLNRERGPKLSTRGS